jgi:hypothetical protein
MGEAEASKDPEGDQVLSRAFANYRGLYLFEQVLAYVFWDDADKEFSVD